MTAAAGVDRLDDRWRRLEALVARAQRRDPSLTGGELAELAALYRAVVADAARARARATDDATLAWLDGLMGRAHNALYRAQPRQFDVVAFVVQQVPQAVRANGRLFALCSLLFWGFFVSAALVAWFAPQFARSLCGEAAIEDLRRMHAQAPQAGRSLTEGLAGVAFYVQHNTSIAFNAFAAGMFAGAGSLYQMVVQGLYAGASIGFLAGDHKGLQIVTFVCGHAAWELTALVVAGTAGLRAGWAWVAPGQLTRRDSLRAAKTDVTTLVAGAAVMLAVAACIEGVWSPSQVPMPLKWAFGALQAMLVAVWLGGWRPPRRPAR